MKLVDKTVLVTGATGGIGHALCALISAAGGKLVLNGLREDALRAMKAQLGLHHHAVCADINTPEGRDSVLQTCHSIGGVDVVVNLAGVLDCHLFAAQHPQAVERIMQVNAVAPMLLTRALLPQLLRKPESLVMNVGSIFGSIGHPGFVAYCASKAAMKMFSEALSRELADTTVKVCHIAPRATDTPLNSDRVRHLNRVLGNHTDTPDMVALEIFSQLQQGQRLRYLGWPEQLFVRVNAVLPAVVHRALTKKLLLIKQILE